MSREIKFIMAGIFSFVALLLGAGFYLTSSLSHHNARKISWQDLKPDDTTLKMLISKVDTKHRPEVVFYLKLRTELPRDVSHTDKMKKAVDEVDAALKGKVEGVNEIVAEYERLQEDVVAELDGQRVRISGYLMPLQVSTETGEFNEFLLVPYSGACIHTPPPPPNQIVFVKTVAGLSYRNESLYTPVTVIGDLSVKVVEKELYLIDGAGNVKSGYAIQALRIGTDS